MAASTPHPHPPGLSPEALAALHPADLATLLLARLPASAWAELGRLPPDRRAETFEYLPLTTQLAVAAAAPAEELAALVAAMDADDRADLWARLPDRMRETLLHHLATHDSDDIRALAAYPPGTAGAVMTSEYAVVAAGMTAAEALAALRAQAASRETIAVAFALSPHRRPLGRVSLEALVVAAPDTHVQQIMAPDPAYVRADAPAEQAARLIERYDLPALVVVDGNETMVGIITADDAMDVAEQEATDDFQKVGGQKSLGVSLREAGIFLLYRKRIGWLLLLIFANLVSGGVIEAFEEVISRNFALLFFLPLLIASAGNAGSQSAVLVVRALATEELRAGDWLRMVRREVVVAGLLGLTMAATVSVLGIWRAGPEIALVVGLTMVLVVLGASLVGLVLPLLLARLKADPATASAPVITTMADASGVIIYVLIAAALL